MCRPLCTLQLAGMPDHDDDDDDDYDYDNTNTTNNNNNNNNNHFRELISLYLFCLEFH